MAGRPYRSLQNEETLRTIILNLPAGVYITTQSGEVLDVNPECLEILGIPSLEALRGYTAEDLFVDPEQREEEMRILHRQGFVREFELHLRRPNDGGIRTVLDTCYQVKDVKTKEILYHGILMDITARKALEELLQQMVIRDPLTGCFNRRYLDQLKQTLEEADACWGAIMADVDDLKNINDRRGHKAGDEALVTMSRFLTSQVRAEDAVVRMGGDEFLVLLVQDQASCTELVAARIRNQSAQAAPVAFSLGWAVREAGESLEKTISRADDALIEVRIRERGQDRRRRNPSRPPIPDGE